jgi:tRNA threonylcarbamoyl adenosine modification protein YeaZ
VKPGDLAAVGVGLGPGPFTGLRVGIVTARAMTDALGVKAFGCSSLSLIGRGPRGIATNARRKQVYWAVRSDGTFAAGPEIGTPEEAAAQFRTAGVQRVAGEGPVLYPEVFAGWSFDDADRYPNVELLVGYVAGRLSEGADSDDLTPMYLRRPDARPLGKPKAVSPA